MLQYFAKDGEMLYERTQFLIMFLAIQLLTQDMIIDPLYSDISKLWNARSSIIYDDLLSSSVVFLQDTSLECFAEMVK